MITYSADTLRTVAATAAAVDQHYPTKGRPASLLTTTNPKVNKQATAMGYYPGILHLAPATMAGANLCPWSSPDCVAGCLNTAGRGGINLDGSGWNMIQAARIRRTARMIMDPDGFRDDLLRSITAHVRTARRHGLTPAVRLNGTSDHPFHRTMPDVIEYAQQQGAILYDYTKRPTPDASAHGIDLTYSYPGGDGKAARRYIENGHRVAVVFATRKGHALPATWTTPWGDVLPVIDGDAHDLRFADPGGVIVGLRAKGRLTKSTPTPGGFLQPA